MPEKRAARDNLNLRAGFMQEGGILQGALPIADHHYTLALEPAELTQLLCMRCQGWGKMLGVIWHAREFRDAGCHDDPRSAYFAAVGQAEAKEIFIAGERLDIGLINFQRDLLLEPFRVVQEKLA